MGVPPVLKLGGKVLNGSLRGVDMVGEGRGWVRWSLSLPEPESLCSTSQCYMDIPNSAFSAATELSTLLWGYSTYSGEGDKNFQ